MQYFLTLSLLLFSHPYNLQIDPALIRHNPKHFFPELFDDQNKTFNPPLFDPPISIRQKFSIFSLEIILLRLTS